MNTIVIPLHPKGGKFKNNTELRYALRSLEKNFTDPFELAVVTSNPPGWLTGVTQLYGEGLKSSLKVAAEAYPEGFFWWYDDCCLLKPSTAEELKVTPACRGWSKAQTGWSNRLNEIKDRLKKEGYTPWDYSRPHGPYWFTKDMVDEGFTDWPGMKSKFPWESWILSKRDWPRRHGVVKQYYGPFRGPPPQHCSLLNYADNGNTPELNGWLKDEFPAFSRFEAESKPANDVIQLPVEHNKTIHFVWIGDRGMPPECNEIMQEWKRLHPDFAFKFWGEEEVANCPYASANVKDTTLAPIFRADLFRLEIMANEGGVYTDLDIRPYKNCWGVFQHVRDFCYSDEWPMEATNAIFMAKGKSRTAQAIRDKIGDISTRTHVHVLNLTGPRALRVALSEICDFSNGVVLPCMGAFYGDVLRLDLGVYLASSAKRTRRAFMSGRRKKGYQYGVHLYAGSWHSARRQKWKTIELEAPKPKDMIEAFDMSKYPLSGEADCAMDDRHIFMLHKEAISDWEGTRIAVEIGSYKGRSTVALIEALNMGRLDHLHIVEPNVSDQLLKVLDAVADKSKLTIHRKPACDTDITRADFVFIDGNHEWWAVSDALRALVWGAKVVCLHDITAYPRMRNCWGAHHAAQALKIAKGRTWKQDSENRPGEDTWRGFGVSRENSYSQPMSTGTRIVVYTLRFGDPPWMSRCVKSLEDWCSRNNYPLNVWTGEGFDYPAVKFCEIDMMRDFLKSDATHMVYIDADVVVHPKCPALPAWSGFMTMSDPQHVTAETEHFRTWCHDLFGAYPARGYKYCNAGIFYCDRVAAEKFLEQVVPPYNVHCQEQHQFNWWLNLALNAGMEFNELPPMWNHGPEHLGPVWMFHPWGPDKMEKIEEFSKAGYL